MEETVQVQCILETGYNDKQLKRFIEKNEVYYVSKERANILKEKGAIRILEEKTVNEPKEIERPKRRNRKII